MSVYLFALGGIGLMCLCHFWLGATPNDPKPAGEGSNDALTALFWFVVFGLLLSYGYFVGWPVVSMPQ